MMVELVRGIILEGIILEKLRMAPVLQVDVLLRPVFDQAEQFMRSGMF